MKKDHTKPINALLYKEFTSLVIFLSIALFNGLPAQYNQPVESSIRYYLGIDDSHLMQNRYPNPAWLYRDNHKNVVRYYFGYNNDNGKFKRPFDPGEKGEMTYRASGLKRLGDKNVFAGSFSYRNKSLKNKMWVHNSMPYTGIPFLLADSSTGGFNLNGILWEVEYASELIQNRLYSGLSIFYNVDEEYKTVFPKSQVKHRDLSIASGFGIVLNRHVSFGCNFRYFDFQEILRTTRYSLEQNKTPIFYKVRGLDNPLIFRGETSEERLYALQGHAFELDGEAKKIIADQINFTSGYEKARSQSEDGGAYPIKQGKWFSDKYFFLADFLFKITQRVGFSLFSFGELNKQTAEHPDLRIEIYEYRTQKLAGGCSFLYHITDGFNISPGLYFSSQTIKRIDKYNGILQYFSTSSIGGTISSNFIFWRNLHTDVAFGSELLLLDGFDIYKERTSFYYDLITKREGEYYKTDKRDYWVKTKFNWIVSPNSRYIIELKYNILKPINNMQFKNLDRKYLIINFIIESSSI